MYVSFLENFSFTHEKHISAEQFSFLTLFFSFHESDRKKKFHQLCNKHRRENYLDQT